jgi:hypothetical protein
VDGDKSFRSFRMLWQATGIPYGKLQEFSYYVSLVSTVLRRFSIVPICSNKLFIMFCKSSISLVCWWLRFVCLFLYNCWCVRILLSYLGIFNSWFSLKGIFLFVQECIVSLEMVGMLLFVALCRLNIPCNLQQHGFYHIWHKKHH